MISQKQNRFLTQKENASFQTRNWLSQLYYMNVNTRYIMNMMNYSNYLEKTKINLIMINCVMGVI
jgi:hypothetical protein